MELGLTNWELVPTKCPLSAWVCVTGDADYTYYSLFHSSQTGYPGNDAFIKNDEVDKLVVAARQTADPERDRNTMTNWRFCWETYRHIFRFTMTA